MLARPPRWHSRESNEISCIENGRAIEVAHTLIMSAFSTLGGHAEDSSARGMRRGLATWREPRLTVSIPRLTLVVGTATAYYLKNVTCENLVRFT